MTMQPNVGVIVAYGAETTFGTASAAAGQKLRRVSSSLALQKDAFTSNEVRSDQQIFDQRHGTRRVAGSISGELSTQTYDDFLEAVMRGTWAAGVSKTNADFTSILVSGSTFVIGGGSFISQGFKTGDVIRLSGFSHANVGVNFRITGLTATVATVTPTPAAMTSQATFTIAVAGKKLAMGTTGRSFTFEHNYPDIDVSEVFTGCRVGDARIALPPTGIATLEFSLQGQDADNVSGASAPFFASPSAETATGVMAGVNGSLSINGSESAIVTGLDFSISNNLTSTPVVGSALVPDIFYGRSVVTGNVSAYLSDATLIDAFLNETEIALVAQLEAAGSDPLDFLTFSFQRLKFTGASKTIGPDQGVIVSFPFQSLLKTGGTGTIYDTSSLVIQRSNS